VNRAKGEKPGIGFNARNGQFVDMLKEGIVDPAKVTKCALQNAASIVSLLLTTDVLIADKPEENGGGAAAAEAAGAQGMPGMGGMGGF